jgi:hypothetical protein
MPTDFTTQVPPNALLGTDVIVRDPDSPDDVVEWPITALGTEGDVVVAEYETGDGTEGRHGFEPGCDWPTVRVRKAALPVGAAA